MGLSECYNVILSWNWKGNWTERRVAISSRNRNRTERHDTISSWQTLTLKVSQHSPAVAGCLRHLTTYLLIIPPPTPLPPPTPPPPPPPPPLVVLLLENRPTVRLGYHLAWQCARYSRRLFECAHTKEPIFVRVGQVLSYQHCSPFQFILTVVISWLSFRHLHWLFILSDVWISARTSHLRGLYCRSKEKT